MTILDEEIKKITVKEYAQKMLTKVYEGMEANKKKCGEVQIL